MKIINQNLWINYLRPNNYVKSINEIDFNQLYNNGIRVIICDLDNTLVPSFKKWPFKATILLIKKIIKIGFKFFIVSNNTKKRVQEFVQKLAQEVKIHGYLASAAKPFLFKINNFIKKNRIDKNETIVIGDQFITDILIANRLNMHNILVLSIIDTFEIGFWNKFLFLIEKFVYKKMAHEKFIDQKKELKNSLDEIELL